MIFPGWLYPVLIWTIIWKAIGCWRAARKGHLIWFVLFFIVNTVGILPIVYILFFENFNYSNKKAVRKKVKKSKKIPSLS